MDKKPRLRFYGNTITELQVVTLPPTQTYYIYIRLVVVIVF